MKKDRGYGLYSQVPEDKSRCVEAIHGGDRWPNWHQCNRKRGFGPGGEFCRIHDPAAVKARGEKRLAAWNRKLEAMEAPGKEIVRLRAELAECKRELAALKAGKQDFKTRREGE